MRQARAIGTLFGMLLIGAQLLAGLETAEAAGTGNSPGSWYASTNGEPTRNNATDPINMVVYGDWNGWDTVDLAFANAGWGQMACCTANPLWAKPTNYAQLNKSARGVGDFGCTTDNCRNHLRIWSDFTNSRYCAGLGCPPAPTKSPGMFPTLVAISYEKCVEKSNSPPYSWLGCKRHEVTDFNNARFNGTTAFWQGIYRVGNYSVDEHFTPAYPAGSIRTQSGRVVPYDGYISAFTVN